MFDIKNGAEGGTRTRTDFSTRPSNVRGYQLRHLSLNNFSNKLFVFGRLIRVCRCGIFIDIRVHRRI